MKPRYKVLFLSLLLVALLFLGWNNGFSLFFRSAYVVVGLIILSRLWLWFNLRQVEGRFKAQPHRLQVGQEVRGESEVWNQDPWPKLGLTVKATSNLPQADGERMIALPAQGQQRWQWSISCQQRGHYNLGPLEVSCHDPFGLFHQARRFGSPQPILVYPALVELFPPTLPPTPFSKGGNLRPQLAGEQAGGIREYQPGDSYSHIHWPSSAKTGRLISKELEGETPQEAWLLLDMDAQAQAGQGVESTWEYGITIAASLARAYLRADYCLGLATWEPHLHLLPPAQGEAHLWQVLETLALLQGQGPQPLSQLIQATAPQYKGEDTIMLITAAPPTSWSPWLHLLLRRGAKVAVVLLEAESFKNGHEPAFSQSGSFGLGLPVYPVRRGQALEHIFHLGPQG